MSATLLPTRPLGSTGSREPEPPRRPIPGALPRWWRDVSAAFAWAVVLFVMALWVAGGGLSDFAAVGGGLTSIGRLTGLLASALILLQVLLMARIPFVEQAWGQDELARIHRLVGFTSFTLMLAHIVFIIIGYSLGTGGDVIRTFIDEVLNAPGMLLALAGTAALVMVVLTSIRRARRRLRYESWHLLHLYAYLGAGLALPHQLWTGQDFLTSPVSTVYWWGLYATAVTAVIVFRVLLPLIRSFRHRLVVSRVVEESPNVTTVVVTGRHLHRLKVRAGQFFQWRFIDGPGFSRANPYSLSAAPDGRSLRITVDSVGDSSERLSHLRVGTRVLVEGPYGRLHAGVRTRDKTLLVGAGIGITPLRALLEELPAGAGNVVVIHRVSSRAEMILGDELLAVAAARGARVVPVVGPRHTRRDSWLPFHAGDVDDVAALQQIVPDIAERDVYICGAPRWMDAVIAAARGAGVPATSIHHERFSY